MYSAVYSLGMNQFEQYIAAHPQGALARREQFVVVPPATGDMARVGEGSCDECQRRDESVQNVLADGEWFLCVACRDMIRNDPDEPAGRLIGPEAKS